MKARIHRHTESNRKCSCLKQKQRECMGPGLPRSPVAPGCRASRTSACRWEAFPLAHRRAPMRRARRRRPCRRPRRQARATAARNDDTTPRDASRPADPEAMPQVCAEAAIHVDDTLLKACRNRSHGAAPTLEVGRSGQPNFGRDQPEFRRSLPNTGRDQPKFGQARQTSAHASQSLAPNA